MKILLALDASQASEHILQEVAKRPWPDGSTCELLTVVPPALPYVMGPVAEAVEGAARKQVGRAAERLRSRQLNAKGLVRCGDPKRVILEQADAGHADLIMVGAHGGGALERFLLGSVSRPVLRHATCSVEIVRRPVRPDAHEYKVLLAVDGSDGAARAADAVAERPWPSGTEVRVLSALELHLNFFRAAFEIPALDPSHLQPQKEEAMRHAQKAIRAALEILERSGVTVTESLSVRLEPPKQIILEEAEEWGADLIILGSHGLRGVNRFLMGSTSEAVATHAKCSVEVVRA